MIGSLLRLTRSAAVQALLDGTEAITRKTLDAIDVDIAAGAGAGGRKPAGTAP